ncbi:MAG: SPOR domain-containing protein [Candidatus Kapabacteria bacterium]|nr:SPOR domain-containing protein [Candidatus Kapabacteria bacterium]
MLAAQSSLVHNRIRLIMAGKSDEVRRELPELLRDFPVDAGVMFLNGILMEDAAKALTVYEQITREHPNNEWADDAQWRIVQFYALKRDTMRTWRELANYKRNYPLSEFLIHAIDIVKATVGLQPATPDVPRKTIATPNAGDKMITPKSVQVPQLSQLSQKEQTLDSEERLMVQSNADKKKGATTTEKPNQVTPQAQTKSPELATETTSGKKWGLQIGVYSSQQSAEAEAQKYRDARLRVDIVPKKTPEATVYAIIIGNYSSKESAEKSRELVTAQCNCTPYIIAK